MSAVDPRVKRLLDRLEDLSLTDKDRKRLVKQLKILRRETQK